MLAVFWLMVSAARTVQGKFAVTGFFLVWTLYPVFFYLGILNDTVTRETAYLGIYTTAVFSKQVFAFIDLMILDKIL
jgi:hypothetical protein